MCLTLGVCVIIYYILYIIHILLYIIHIHIIYYYILYYTLPILLFFFLLSFSFFPIYLPLLYSSPLPIFSSSPLLLFQYSPSHSYSNLSPLLFSSQSISFPILILYVSVFIVGYLYLRLIILNPKLTPHVLSEWMVEVCAGD